MHSLWRVFDKKGMTEMSKLSIPVGISNFEKIRNGGFYYIDKTGLISAKTQKNYSMASKFHTKRIYVRNG